MPVCEICRNEYQEVARFCPNCGAPLSALAARLRDEASPDTGGNGGVTAVPDLEDAETEA